MPSHSIDKGKKLPISGYGIELAIKQSEYKAVDDSKIRGSESTYL